MITSLRDFSYRETAVERPRATTLSSEHRDSFMALQVWPECHPAVTAPKPVGLHMADTCHRSQVAATEFTSPPRFFWQPAGPHALRGS